MTLQIAKIVDLLDGLDCLCYGELGDILVEDIITDSRQAGRGKLFVALPGLTADGHDFVDQALKLGCLGAVVEKGRGWASKAGSGTVIVEVADCRDALGQLAAGFFSQPAQALTMVGITGTNGKTTTTYLLESMIRQAGGNPAVIGTINYRFNNTERPAAFTTPEPMVLQGLLREMVDGGITHLIMEVSSHGLALKRLGQLEFDVALFTNLSRDHLDFHGTMDQYFQAKTMLFTDHLKKDGKAVVVINDEADHQHDWGARLIDYLGQQTAITNRPVSCGMDHTFDIHPAVVNYGMSCTEARVETTKGGIDLKTPLVGEFNLKNILGAIGTGLALGLAIEEIENGLGRVDTVPGRLERVGLQTESDGSLGVEPMVYVDYAHTPEALEKVLQTLRSLGPEKLIVVFGCGGDRDPGKRPLMGVVAGRLADLVIITSDNSRSEPLEKIMDQIEVGVVETGKEKIELESFEKSDSGLHGYTVCPCRRQAIKAAIGVASSDDLVLISGKGHETYQIDQHGTSFFDDRLEARNEILRIHG